MFAIRRFALCLVAIGASVAVADDKDNEKALQSIEGKYVIIGLEKEKQKITEADLKKVPNQDVLKVEIKGNKIIANFSGKPDEATLTLDASKKPMWLDITSKKDKPEVDYGIFKLDGDTLTICAAEKGVAKDRPTEFKATGNIMIMTLKKQK